MKGNNEHQSDFKKAPYLKVCKLTNQQMKNLIGLNVGTGFRQRIYEAIGGKNGCHHLVDLTLEMAKSLNQFIPKEFMFHLGDYIDDASALRKKILESYPPAKDMCWAYNIANDHLFTKDVKCGLQPDLVI